MKKTLAIILCLALTLTSTLAVFDDDAWKENTGNINLTEMKATGEGVTVSDGDVKITKGGDFTVYGTLADGMIYINTDEKVKLRLNGVKITNSDGPAIFYDNADKALITIEKGTENYLEDGESYKEDAKAALFSNDDLEIKGGGKLFIKANYKHGIASDDDVVIENGIIEITSKEHGIKANDLLCIIDGEISVVSKEGKGLKADKEILLQGGKLNLVSETNEGIESEGTLTIEGGDIYVKAKSDGINTGASDSATEHQQGGKFMGHGGGDAKTLEGAASSAITISGGNIFVETEEDGIDSNGSLLISGGVVTINGPASGGNGSLDYGRGFDMTGGTLIALSGMDMMNIPKDVTQNTAKVYFNNQAEAGSVVSVKCGDEEILSVTAKVNCRGILYSSEKIEEGKEYKVYVNGNEEGVFTAEKGVTTAGTASGGRMPGGNRPEGGKPHGEGRFPGRNPDRIRVTLDGKELFFNTDPVIKNGTTLVGFRAILEALGANVTWDADVRMAGAEKDGIKIELYIDSVSAYVNGEEKLLLTAPEIIGGSTMIPVRFVSENLGMKVDWNAEEKCVIIVSE